MTPLARQVHEVPAAIRSLDAIERAGYVDVFAVTAAAPEASPEEWARTIVERGAAARGGQFVWRVLMGLRLDPAPSPDRIGGWDIAERGETWIRLEASSWCATAHIVVHHTGDGEVVAATALHYDRAIAKPLWLPIAAGHRKAMPRLLGYAARLRKRAGAEVSPRGR